MVEDLKRVLLEANQPIPLFMNYDNTKVLAETNPFRDLVERQNVEYEDDAEEW